VDSVGNAGGIIVGVIMMLIGFFGVFQARRKYLVIKNQGSITTASDETKQNDKSKLLGALVEAKNEGNEFEGDQQSGPMTDLVRPCSCMNTDRPALAYSCGERKTVSDSAPEMDDDAEKGSLSSLRVVDGDASADDPKESRRPKAPICALPCALCARSKDLLLAVVFGLVHGVAGAGGVLAVIPTLSMTHDPNQAAAYLLAFFAASILAMGALAAVAGGLSGEMGPAQAARLGYRTALAASLLSVATGILWEILLSLDMLDAVFR
jgi:hypothetical protein